MTGRACSYDSHVTGRACCKRRGRLQQANIEADILNEVIEDEEEEECELEEVQIAKCHCGKGASQPNKMMATEIELCKVIMKDKSKREMEWRRDDSVSSRNLLDYCTQFILSFHPLKMMDYAKHLVCWDKSCSGQ